MVRPQGTNSAAIRSKQQAVKVQVMFIKRRKYLYYSRLTTSSTEKDIGAKTPRAAPVLGFFRAFFQGGIQKISFHKNDLWGGLG